MLIVFTLMILAGQEEAVSSGSDQFETASPIVARSMGDLKVRFENSLSEESGDFEPTLMTPEVPVEEIHPLMTDRVKVKSLKLDY